MSTATLPPYISRAEVHQRLHRIFPEGYPSRGYVVREMAASTVFTMLYIGAIEGGGRHLAPSQVCRMDDKQAKLTSDALRIEYAAASTQKRYVPRGGRGWYEANTREPIRDETLRQGLVPCGAVVVDKSIPTTSSRGRYSLAEDFGALFNPRLSRKDLEEAIATWQRAHLSRAALARMAIVQFGASRDDAGVEVTFPSGETQRLAAGESSRIAKMVIEEFAPRFLEKPAVLLLSESGNKMVVRHETLLKLLKLDINISQALPDILLADLPKGGDLLLVFVEVVSTDGVINDLRKRELLEITTRAGYSEQDVAFLTAFMDRDSAPLKRSFSALAWNSFAWFASEPDGLVPLLDRSTHPGVSLRQLVRSGRLR